MKKCGNCGFVNEDSSKFCNKCGERLDSLLSGDPRGVKGLDLKPYSFWREFPILILGCIGIVAISVIAYILYAIFGNIYVLIAVIATTIVFFVCLLKVILALIEWSKESKQKKHEAS